MYIYKADSKRLMSVTKEFYTQSYGVEKVVASYYAIDTDKGLIYVAKMNEEGELELL